MDKYIQNTSGAAVVGFLVGAALTGGNPLVAVIGAFIGYAIAEKKEGKNVK